MAKADNPSVALSGHGKSLAYGRIAHGIVDFCHGLIALLRELRREPFCSGYRAHFELLAVLFFKLQLLRFSHHEVLLLYFHAD